MRAVEITIVGLLALLALGLAWGEHFGFGPTIQDDSVEVSDLHHPMPMSERISAELSWTGPTISGRVFAEDGDLQGATVCAHCVFPDCVVAVSRKRCGESDEDGEYRIEGLTRARYQVVADIAGYLAATWQSQDGDEVDLRLVSNRDDIDFELDSGGVLVSGTIRDRMGGTVAGAIVFGRNDLGPETAAVMSDTSGRYQLWIMAGEVGIVAEAEGYIRGVAPATAPASEIDVELWPESQIVGRVVIAGTDTPLADVPVRAIDSPFAMAAATTAADGSFALCGLEPGRYSPTVITDGWAGYAGSVEVGLLESAGPILIEARPAFAVFGKVVIEQDGQQKPCAGAKVALGLDGPDPLKRYAEAGADGQVALTSLLAGAYDVVVLCDGYERSSSYDPVVVEDRDLHELVWRVEGGLSVTGRVVHEDGGPAKNVEVVLLDDTNAGFRVTTDVVGRFVFGSQASGDYRLWLTCDPENIETFVLDDDGTHPELVLVAPQRAELRGKVMDEFGEPVKAFSIKLYGGPRVESYYFDNAAGAFAMEGLLPGAYSLRAERQSTGALEQSGGVTVVELLPGERTVVDIEVEALNYAITGIVLDNNGAPIADAVVAIERGGEAEYGLREGAATTDATGRFIVSELAAGRYFVRAYLPGVGEARTWAKAGEDVSLVIDGGSALFGTFELPDGSSPPYVTVSVSGHDGMRRRETFVATHGRFHIAGLPQGRFGVYFAVSAGAAFREVEMEGDELDLGTVLLQTTIRIE
ncbi:MAG: hypothetical protein A2289_13960 [Deltaproteobacteria bacterium RIFOXYA12_FULL_58_15]|nr:MAG: hypothetical protein A2289_13960 [Deltaproteobacteria bacterium RIFOXYA12_FULL_58_15]